MDWMQAIRERRSIWGAALLLLVVTLAVYATGLHGDYHFDDQYQIQRNDQITVWPSLMEVLRSQRGIGELTFRLNAMFNQAWLGDPIDTFSFLLVNVLIHVVGCWCLFGIVRRTLLRPCFSDVIHRRSLPIALTISLLWAVHPLNTQAITYIIQRYESLMGLCFLLTFYAHLRAGDARRIGVKIAWHALSILTLAIGFRVKQVIVVAPLLLLLHDWVFSDRQRPMRQVLLDRWPLYAVMLLVQAGLVVSGVQMAVGSGLDAGFSVEAVSPHVYLFSQAGVILHYLRLSFWPDPLALDYLWRATPLTWEKAGYLTATVTPIALLLLLSGWGLWKRHWAGFCGAWFFLILAPTSSVMPIIDLCVEHRMYLPLIGVLAAAVGGAVVLADRLVKRAELSVEVVRAGQGVILVLVLLGLGSRTLLRNLDYADTVTLWQVNTEAVPTNPRGYFNLGAGLTAQERFVDAVEAFKQALRIEPRHPDAWSRLGQVYEGLELVEYAVAPHRHSVEIKPDSPEYQFRYGFALAQTGQWEDAQKHLEQSLALDEKHAETWQHLGTLYARQGRLEDAERYLRQALELRPDLWKVHGTLAQVLNDLGRPEDALVSALIMLEGEPSNFRAFYQLRRACAAVDPPHDPIEVYWSRQGTVATDRGDGWRLLAVAHAVAPDPALRDVSLALRLINRHAQEAAEGTLDFEARAIILEQAGDMEAARNAVDQAIAAMTSSDVPTRNRLMHLRDRLERSSKGQKPSATD